MSELASPDLQVPVLIVGGSLVGLTTSALLSSYGVDNLVVERHRGTAIHPRAASFHQRTMEVFRTLGLQEAVEDAAAQEFVQNGAIVAVESLGGKELHHFFRNFNEGVEELSPTSRLFITQVGLEPVLRDKARSLGGEVEFGTELVSFEQDADGVTAVVRARDGGSERVVRAGYLVAADGAHSSVREQLGIPTAGRGDFADCITIYFDADVKDLLGDRNLSVIYVTHPELLGFFRFSITGDSGFLAVFSTIGADGSHDTHVGQMSDPERCAGFVRTALGSAPDLPVAVKGVQRWSASAGWAERFSDGRVFLVGDAAHVMPPTGGFGGNTGILDAYNLAWKLAQVIDGVAAPALLDSYDAERRPASSLVVEQAYTRYVLRVDPALPQENLAPPMDDPSIELGTVHHSAAVAATDEPGDSSALDDPRSPRGRLGVRAPHLTLRRADCTVSTHDLVGREWVLLAGPDGADWCKDADGYVAYRVGPDGDLTDPDGGFLAAFGIAPEGAVLVRPDGILAWRSPSNATADATTATSALRRLLQPAFHRTSVTT